MKNRTLVRFTYLWDGSEGKAMEQIIRSFNSSQNEILVQGLSNPRLNQLAALKEPIGSFDITDGSSIIAPLAGEGLMEPLDEYMARDSYDTADFLPSAMEVSRYGGQTYALPLAVYTMQLIYNKKLFRDAGISDPPRTTSEWAADIAKLTKVENGELVQLGLANLDLKTMAIEFGGRWFDEKQTPTPNDPGNVAAAQFYVDNIVSKYGAANIQKFTTALNSYSSQNPFYQGKVAMMFDGAWQSAFIKQYAPKLEWGVTALPYPDDKPELVGATQLNGSVIFIPHNSQQKDAAWTFMKYLLENKSMLSFTHATANLPARTSLIGDHTYDDLGEFHVWLSSLRSPNTKPFSSTLVSQQYLTDISTAVKTIVLAEKTPQESLSELAEKVARYGR